MLALAARIAAAAAVLALAAPPGDARDPRPVRVLIIGNSLTFANDLPAMVEAVARSSGAGTLKCAAVALPDFGLQEHWQHGEALRMLQRTRWTHVVLQQGPSSLPESRRVLIEYARKFAPAIREAGASILLYGVWPPASRSGAFDAVTASYAAAAEETGGRVVPVGEAWKLAWRQDASLPFYGPDGFHPSPLGTYVAALMLFEAVTGRQPAELPAAPDRREPALRAISVSPAQLIAVRNAAGGATGVSSRR